MNKNLRENLSVSEVGDRSSTASNLVMAGTRLKDGFMIKEGVKLFKTIGYPVHFLLTLLRYLVSEAKK